MASHGGGNNRLDDQLAEPGFSDVDDHVMDPLARVGRGGGPGPEHPGGGAGCRKLSLCPPVPSSLLSIR